MIRVSDGKCISTKADNGPWWLCLAIIGPALENFMGIIFPSAVASLAYVDVLLAIPVWLYIIFNSVNKNLSITMPFAYTVLLMLGFSVMWFLSKLITPDVVYVVDHPTVSFFLKCAPLFYFGLTMKDYKTVLHGLQPYIWFSLIYGMVAFGTIRTANYGGDAMSVSYDILGGGMLAFALYSCEKKKLYLSITVAIMLLLLLLGSRGALAIMLIYVLVAALIVVRKKTRFVVFALAVLFVTAFMLLLLEPMLDFVTRMFPDSRVVQLLASGELLRGSGRNELTAYGLNVLAKSPFEIRGIFADRVVLIDYFGGTSLMGFWVESDAGSTLYAHNIFLELVMQFGVILGGALCIYILVQNVKGLRFAMQTTDLYTSLLVIFFICRGTIQLLVSSSYTLNPWFWLFLGVAVSLKRSKAA